MNTPNLAHSVIFFCAGMSFALGLEAMLPASTVIAAASPAASTAVATATSSSAATPAVAEPTITPMQTTAFPARTKVTSTVIDSTKLRTSITASGKRAEVFNGPSGTLQTFESHITTVDPGKSAHDPHTHPHEEMLILKEGKLEVTLAGKTYIAEPGAIIFYGPNDPHGTKSIGTVPAVYYVFTWVTDQTQQPDVTTPYHPATTATTTP
ncbi:MAG TPA: cupin domain-containing protein [Opitutales bacterium]|nr:cupin domain-containing protein [Opitutales bacterium]